VLLTTPTLLRALSNYYSSFEIPFQLAASGETIYRATHIGNWYSIGTIGPKPFFIEGFKDVLDASINHLG
jgi:hypothetical protein